MKTTPYVLGVLVLIILAGAVGLAFRNNDAANRVASVSTYAECVAAGYPIMESYPEQCRTPDGRTFVNTPTSATTTTPNPPAGSAGPVSTPNVSDRIRVVSPIANQTIASGFNLKGEARGNWYFEASFPAKILDANGKQIAIFPVTADGEWMTTNFVPFEQIVTFPVPETSTGYVVLENDNPSGLPENSAQLVIPIKFATSSAETIAVKVFFSNAGMTDPDSMDCSEVYSVVRTIPKTLVTGKASIEELLKGPLTSELALGYRTNLNTGVNLNSLTIANGVARVDFNDALDRNVGGSCRVIAIRSQIEQTLKQFSSIKQVIITRDGSSPEVVLQP